MGVYVAGRGRNASHLSVFLRRVRLRLLVAAYCFKISPFVHNIGDHPIRRPNRAPPAAAKDGPRVNDDIRNAQIQLIDQTGQNHGTVETVVAIKMAMDAGMDLVEISDR